MGSQLCDAARAQQLVYYTRYLYEDYGVCGLLEADLSVAVLVSAFPYFFTRWCTRAYVATIRIHLPTKARVSRETLHAFAAHMPPETTLEFTTVGSIGLQSTTTTSLAKLSPLETRTGIGNIQRAVEHGHGHQTLVARYKRLAQGSTFYVGGDEGSIKSNAPGIWHAVMHHIQRGPPRRGRLDSPRALIRTRNIK